MRIFITGTSCLSLTSGLSLGECLNETLVVVLGSPLRFIVTIHWLDSEGEEYSREHIVTW